MKKVAYFNCFFGEKNMLLNSYGIDFGTSYLKIFNMNKKNVLKERNIIALDSDNKVIAVGDEAYVMYEKAPESVQVSYPISEGVISSIENTKTILKKYIGSGVGLFSKTCDYFITLPTDITEVQKRAFHKLITSSNIYARKVYTVEKPIADAIGMGVNIDKPDGVMVIDIGASTSEISVISMNTVVHSTMIPVGGNKIDEAILNYLKKTYNFLIGLKTAENLKKLNLCALTEVPDKHVNVTGFDMLKSLPVEREVSQNELVEPICECLNSIIDGMKTTLERTPPELSADILKNGIYLTGGTSLLRRIADYFETTSGIKVHLADSPSESAIRGLSLIICNPQFRNLASEPKEKIYY